MTATCDMVTGHTCDEHGEPVADIECGKPIWLASGDRGYCREHADATYADGLDTFTREDAARYLDIRAAEIPRCTAETCAGQNCESCRWRHAAHEHREWMKTRAG